jgi:hypothetical protein
MRPENTAMKAATLTTLRKSAMDPSWWPRRKPDVNAKVAGVNKVSIAAERPACVE